MNVCLFALLQHQLQFGGTAIMRRIFKTEKEGLPDLGQAEGAAALLQQLVAALLVEPAALRGAVPSQAVRKQPPEAGSLLGWRQRRRRLRPPASVPCMEVLKTGVQG